MSHMRHIPNKSSTILAWQTWNLFP